jgi:hypothetical protein
VVVGVAVAVAIVVAVVVTASGTALGYGLDDRVFESWQSLGIFLFTTASKPVLGPTQAFYPMGTNGFLPGSKVAGA